MALAGGLLVGGGLADAQVVRHTTHQTTADPPASAGYIYYPLSPRRDSETILAEGELPEDILHQFLEDHSAMRYHLAAESALRLVEIGPHVALAHYNLACVMSRLRRLTEAFDALERAVDVGWRDLHHLRLDPDLMPLRGDERFAELMDRVHQLNKSERLVKRPLRTDAARWIIHDLQSSVEDILRSEHIPGAVVGLVRESEVVWISAFGTMGSDGSSAPLTPATVFRIPRAADALLMCAAAREDHAGRLELTTLLRLGFELHAQAERSAPAPRSPGRAPALGFPDGALTGVSDSRRGESRQRPRGAIRPRSMFESFDLLRIAVENASAQSFERYCREQLLRPLLMVDTGFDAGMSRAPVAVGHSMFGTPVTGGSAGSDRPVTYSSAGDIAQLMAELLSPDDESSAITGLSRDTLTGLIRLNETLPANRHHGLGLGLNLSSSVVGPRVELADSDQGQGCLMVMYPEQGSGIVILCNSETGLPAARRIAHIALGGV